jgi:hypothetical protein
MDSANPLPPHGSGVGGPPGGSPGGDGSGVNLTGANNGMSFRGTMFAVRLLHSA